MTDQGYRHYVLIVDRSGSMSSIQDEAQNGVRHFVREQDALPGRATLSLYQFDNVHDTVHDFVPLSAAVSYELMPRNMTALLDAVGFAFTETGEKLAALPEDVRPGKVIVLITTDGLENASHEYTLTQVRELVTRQQDQYGWQVSYVGANVDAFTEAGGMGIHGGSTLSYAATRSGTQSAYGAASASAGRFVSGQAMTVDYLEEERKAAADEQAPEPE